MAELKDVQQQTWVLDQAHSKIGFSAKHMVISNVRGQFDSYKVEVKSAGPNLEDKEVYVEIDANSINTGVEARDQHLKTPDFFEAEKYPKITFKSKSIKKIDEENYKLTGDFTIRDITKELELDLEYGGQIKDPWGNERIGLSLKGSIDRFDYNLKWNSLIETGGAVVGKTIKLNIEVEFTLQ
jgi:polyisoprenoid-binding protein YceI